MGDFYTLKVAGLERQLPKVKINDELAIASFVMLGDTELIEECAEAIILHEDFPKDEIDILCTPEAKGIPLVHAIARRLGKDYVIARKSVKGYMNNPMIEKVQSITTIGAQTLVLDSCDVEKLKEKKLLVWFEFYEHDYPICWRCGTRAIIRTTKQWFLNVQKIKEKLLNDLEKVRFVPESAKEAFKNVIKTAPDWVISRQRFWGIPLPVWKCKNGHVYVVGSVEELEKLTGKEFKKFYIVIEKNPYAKELLKDYFEIKKVVEMKEEEILEKIDQIEKDTFVFVKRQISEETLKKIKEKGYFIVRSLGQKDYELIRVYNYDLHRPYVDQITFKCPVCGEEMKRVEDVLDVWIDSGSAPFASREKPIYPVDFITEGLDQLRGWFYSLAVLGEIYFDEIPYRNVYVHGWVLDPLGRKMSKSLGNVVLPEDIIKNFGADVGRFYFATAAKAYEDIKFDINEIRAKYDSLNILWNIHRYLIDQCDFYGINPAEKKENEIELKEEDRWILHLLEKTKKEVEEALEKYEIWKVGRLLENLWLELSRTYIKIIRERIQEDEKERKAVFYVIFKVLLETINMFSIVCPFITEAIYQNLRKAFKLKEESVHLLKWPKIREEFINEEIEKDFELFKEILEAGLRLRERKLGYGIRWPVREMLILTPYRQRFERIVSLIKRQLNVKEVKFVEELPIEIQLKCDTLKQEDIPKVVSKIIQIPTKTLLEKLLKEGKIEIEGVELKKENFEIKEKGNYVVEITPAGIIAFSKEIVEEEGFAREVIRHLQEIRKKMGLKKKQKVILYIEGELVEIVKKYEEKIKKIVGAEEINYGIGTGQKFEIKIKGKELRVWISVIG